MKSQIRENIISNEKIVHNSSIEAKKLYEIAKNMDVEIQKLADMFQLKEMARHKIKRQKGKVKVKLYTIYELQDIEKQIEKELKRTEKINQQVIKNIRNKYKIGDYEMRTFLNISYNQLIKLKKDKKYEIKNTLGEEISNKEISKKYRTKAYIYPEDIKEIRKKYQYNTKQIAKIFHIPIEKVKNLENKKTKKARIYMYTQKDKEKIIIKNKKILEKQKCTLKQLEEIIQKQSYDKEIILEILGITNIQYQNLKNNKIKKITIGDAELKEKVNMCILDIENLYGYGRKMYQYKELDNILENYKLEIGEFVEYSDKKERVRKMYQESLTNNKKIQMNPETKMSKEFFEENQEELERKIKYIVSEFCYTHKCYKEKEDYIQDMNEFIWSQGGYITENMEHNKEKCINILCSNVKAKLINKYYKQPIELRIDKSYQGTMIQEDYNKNYMDTRFSPEQILEQKEEITLLHRIIMQNIKGKIDFVTEMPEDFYEILAFELGIECEEIQMAKEQMQLIILQNKLAKQDKFGRIIPMEVE